jgi:hypothetical protein
MNLKRKVVLAKIPDYFLVGDRRHTILYARLRRIVRIVWFKHILLFKYIQWD